jgi:hypothetical protein
LSCPFNFRAAPIAASMAGDRPEAIDPHPAGAVMIVEGSQGCDFLGFREECRRSRAGEESRDRLLRG